jgi:predicted nucleic acid-binding protein
MIYLDTSVALAHLLAEDRHPPSALLDERLIASRLLEYELLTALNASGRRDSHLRHADALLQRVALVELDRPILERATQPFPRPLRTLDALHLSTFDYLRRLGQPIALASYDLRMLDVARSMAFDVVEL